jgi:uncharacterized Zn finger protein
MMARENAETKGRRYVAEGRLTVDHVSADEIRARCRGDGAVYQLGLNRGEWYCNCPALGRCSHLVALKLVTVGPRS